MKELLERLERIEAALAAVRQELHVGHDDQTRRLERIEASLVLLVNQDQTQEWYDTKAAAKELGKSPYTVRKHCRGKRIHAEKRQCGRGRSKEWRISHAELLRIKAEGLLPAPRTNRRTAGRSEK